MSPARPGRDDADGPEPRPLLVDEEALRAWGSRLGAAAASEGMFVALYGSLGAGKSTVVRAAAAGAGVGEGRVPSPTYRLVHEHRIAGDPGDGATFFHVDLYRLGDADTSGSGGGVGRSLEEIGWDRILSAPGPVFVEWADRAVGELPDVRWEVRLEVPEDRSLRRVRVARRGGAPRPPSPETSEGPGGAIRGRGEPC